MSRISPKLIDVERNRIGTEGGKQKVISTLDRKQSNMGWNTRYVETDDTIRGRFPTQLFTNITDDKYKYVKSV